MITKNEHIISLLEKAGVGSLGQEEISVIEYHTGNCQQCLKAYRASQIAVALLKARSSETLEPSLFFKTRVMAAMKEDRAAPDVPALVRLWRAAGALASLMIVIVMALAALTFLGGTTDRPTVRAPARVTADMSLFSNNFSAERLLFEDDVEAADSQMSDSQVLETVFAAEDADGNQ